MLYTGDRHMNARAVGGNITFLQSSNGCRFDMARNPRPPAKAEGVFVRLGYYVVPVRCSSSVPSLSIPAASNASSTPSDTIA